MKRLGVTGAGLLCACAFGQTATFKLLRNETFPFLSMAFASAMSSDGKVIISLPESKRWSRDLGVVPTGFLPGTWNQLFPRMINGDGTVEYGEVKTLNNPQVTGVYWLNRGQLTYRAGSNPAVQGSGPGRMTDDGVWFVGTALAGGPARLNQNNVVEKFPVGDFVNAQTYGTSADGRVTVGYGTKLNVVHGIAWTISGGPAESAVLISVPNFRASAVSGDGKLAAGDRGGPGGLGDSGSVAAIWTIGGGIEEFNPPLGFTTSTARGISDEGRFVVGTCVAESNQQLFIRRKGEQARDLRDVLRRFGVPEMEYQILTSTVLISRDGTIVSGSSRSPWVGEYGFVATIPDWEPCPSDLNFDGLVDDADFSVFASAYDRLTTTDGDLTVDRVTDDADFSVFAVAYDVLLCP